jgi:hypothetical protein
MGDLTYAPGSKRDGVTIPTIWVAVVLSVLLHIALMWKWLPQIHLPSLDDKKGDEASGSLVVRLAPPPRPPTPPSAASTPSGAPTLQAQPSPRRESRPAAPPPPPPSAPVIALNQPAAPAAPTAPAPPPVAAPARPSAEGDLASYIESRRRARNESGAPAPPAQTGLPAAMASAPQQFDDDKERSNRVVASNLAPRKQAFGYDPSKSGGVFEIKREGYSDAEFVFFGWDKAIRRNTMQLIEVQKGNNSDIRIAIIRRMIVIIREYEVEDFLWESQRLRRNVTLSARLRDNAGLEQFLMREFFPEDPRAR